MKLLFRRHWPALIPGLFVLALGTGQGCTDEPAAPSTQSLTNSTTVTSASTTASSTASGSETTVGTTSGTGGTGTSALSSTGSAGADNNTGGEMGQTSVDGMAGAAGAAGAPNASRTDCVADRRCAGYTLIGSPENDGGSGYTAFLIDMEGDVVHRFSITGFPPKMLPGGSLIGCTGVYPTSYDCVEMQQRSWDDQLEWSFSEWVPLQTGTASRHHHDLQREGNPVGFYAPGQDFLPQGNTLVLAHKRKNVPEIRTGSLDDDVIYEVDWNGQLTGFEWHGSDHFDEFGFDAEAKQDIATRSASVLEWLHGNSISLVGPNRWFDQGHTEFDPENIIYSSRQAAFTCILSRQTGDVVWRIGPDFAGRPEEALGQFAGQHNPHLIPVGLPGAGNMLVYDNGGSSGFGGPNNTNRYSRNYSRIVEFDPVSFEIVWEYGSPDGPDFFFSPLLSNAQRLPNGNTLITIGVAGELIEVTPDKQIVWRYHDPDGPAGQLGWIYRSYRIPPEWLPAGVNEAAGNYSTWASQFNQ